MSSLLAGIATAVALFAGTNADDLVVLALLSAASRTAGRPRRWQIWAGQYLGFAVLAGLSVAASRGLALLPSRWLWLLALLPLALGLGYLAAAVRSLRRGTPPALPSAGGLPGVAMLAITNGADGLATYTPFFTTSSTAQVSLSLAVFAVCVALWCLAGELLTRSERVLAAVGRYGQWILPAAFILIGLYVLYKTRSG